MQRWGRWTDEQIDKVTHRWTERQADRNADGWTGLQKYKQINQRKVT